jgi:hypothetical protein
MVSAATVLDCSQRTCRLMLRGSNYGGNGVGNRSGDTAVTETEAVACCGDGNRGSSGENIEAAELAAEKLSAVAGVVAERIGAVVAATAAVAMAPADNSGNGECRQWRWQVQTEAAAGAYNNQPESGSNSGGGNGDRGGDGDGGSGGSSNGSDGGTDSGLGGAYSGRGGGRCSCRRIHLT